MTAIQIRDVPDEVRDALAAQAAASGQSLQGYLLGLVVQRARAGNNAALLRRMASRDDGTRAPAGAAAVELLDERSGREDAAG